MNKKLDEGDIVTGALESALREEAEGKRVGPAVLIDTGSSVEPDSSEFDGEVVDSTTTGVVVESNEGTPVGAVIGVYEVGKLEEPNDGSFVGVECTGTVGDIEGKETETTVGIPNELDLSG